MKAVYSGRVATFDDHVGTTDVPIPAVSPEPRPTDAEIDFILDTAGRYLVTPPKRTDVLSTWAGSGAEPTVGSRACPESEDV